MNDAVSQQFDESESSLRSEIFVEPYLNGALFYIPRLKVAALLREELAKLIASEVELEDSDAPALANLVDALGLPKGWRASLARNVEAAKWAPTSVIISNTQKCTLRCAYCYIDGGRLEDLAIDLEVAEAAIDLAFRNGRLHSKAAKLNFLGEGEATADWISFRHIIEYYKRKRAQANQSSYIQLSTNGVFASGRLRYVSDNCDRITISVDGLAPEHNSSRMLPNGKGSFRHVRRTMAGLDRLGKPYSIRATITDKSVDSVGTFVEWLAAETGCKDVQLEPVFDTSQTTRWARKEPPLSPERFISAFRDARRIGARVGITVDYSGADLGVRDSFCGAADASNFVVTTKGVVSACNEVMLETDARARLFHYGRWNAAVKQFEINQASIRQLGKLRVQHVRKCARCFARYNCAGDCYAKTTNATTNPWDAPQTHRCTITRELLKDSLALRILRG